MLNQIPDEWRLLVRFLLESGLRISEAVALTWADVDLGRKRVRVRRRVYRGKVAPPKSRYGRRVTHRNQRIRLAVTSNLCIGGSIPPGRIA